MDYNNDKRLDILVLGPMGDSSGTTPSTIQIKSAIDTLLDESNFQALLTNYEIQNKRVHVPEGQNEQEIVENILGLLDSADLVIFDLTPKDGNGDRANVFYELALAHSLGLPCLLLVEEGANVPFYARTSLQFRVPDFLPQTLTEQLRGPLFEFLDIDNRTKSFANSRVTQFYGLPILDISAAVGLATGYYYNFLSRLITEGSYLATYPELIRQVIYVRPSSLQSTYETDHATLKALLKQSGYDLKTEKLPPHPFDDKGMLWFDHVDGIVLDIPRTIYPLRRSPRLLSLQDRARNFSSPRSERIVGQRSGQMEGALLDRIRPAIDYQMKIDGPRVRESILHFTTIAEAPLLVRNLLEKLT